MFQFTLYYVFLCSKKTSYFEIFQFTPWDPFVFGNFKATKWVRFADYFSFVTASLFSVGSVGHYSLLNLQLSKNLHNENRGDVLRTHILN